MSEIYSSQLLKKGPYTILKHTLVDSFHFDLILDAEPLCVTFQSPSLEFTEYKRIKDHRKKYLNFEGLISKEKGRVEIIEQGQYELKDDGTLVLLSENNKRRVISVV